MSHLWLLITVQESEAKREKAEVPKRKAAKSESRSTGSEQWTAAHPLSVYSGLSSLFIQINLSIALQETVSKS